MCLPSDTELFEPMLFAVEDVFGPAVETLQCGVEFGFNLRDRGSE